ncbi:hypothetical protein PR048_027306 [Dryococelus australis]|uniref:Uncharacterized protein n=1 Tax=Dryococelus australis TaxID=614101 RepID=A0ABQ9GGF1_9NEOP|nr:hypothetical protein PR048_027306 [Dryococelus australis]
MQKIRIFSPSILEEAMYTISPQCVYAKRRDQPEIEVERSWIHSGEGYEAQLACIVHAEPAADDKIDVKQVYTEADFVTGSQFMRHALDDSEPIADLQGNK